MQGFKPQLEGQEEFGEGEGCEKCKKLRVCKRAAAQNGIKEAGLGR